MKVVLFHKPNSVDIMFIYSKCGLKLLIKFYEMKYLSEYFRFSLIKVSKTILRVKKPERP